MHVEILEPLHKLVDMFGATSALAIVAWWWERRANRELQKRLLRLATAQIQAATELKATLEAIKEILRRES